MRALIVGLDPDLLDQSNADQNPDPKTVTASRVRKSMRDAVESLQGDGIDAEVFLLEGPTCRSLIDLSAALSGAPVDAVMIGAGVRLEPSLSWFLERMVEVVRTVAPSARLCFNETPEAMALAVRRALLPDTMSAPW